MKYLDYAEIKENYIEKKRSLQIKHNQATNDDALDSPRREQVDFLNKVIAILDASPEKDALKAAKLTAMFMAIAYTIYYYDYGNKNPSDKTNSYPFLQEFSVGKRPRGTVFDPESSLLYKFIPEIIGLSPANPLKFDGAMSLFSAGSSFLTSQIRMKNSVAYDITNTLLQIKTKKGETFDVMLLDTAVTELQKVARVLSNKVESIEASKQMKAQTPEKASSGFMGGLFGGGSKAAAAKATDAAAAAAKTPETAATATI